jgi:hypothetical protein
MTLVRIFWFAVVGVLAICVVAVCLLIAGLSSGPAVVEARPAPPPHVTIDTRDRLLSVDTTHLSADYLICVDDACGLASEWARVSASLTRRANALGR